MLPALLITSGISLVLFLTGFFVVLTPLPFVVLAVKKGRALAGLALVLALAVLALLYALSSSPSAFLPMATFYPHMNRAQVMVLGLLYFFYYGWIGMLLAFLANQKTTLDQGGALILLGSLTVPSLLLWGTSSLLGLHIISELRGGLQYVIDQMIELQSKSGLKGEEMIFLKENGSLLIDQVLRVLPAFWVNGTLVVVSLNVLFLRRWMALHKPFPGWVDFTLWRLNERLIWAPILAGGAYFLNYYLGHWNLAHTLLVNVLLVLVGIYFFQGLAVISFFFRSRLPPLLRLMAYGLLILFLQVLLAVVVALGLFDFWFDFRKLKKLG